MKERGLIYKAPMVRAILDDLKTQTRRLFKYPKWSVAGSEIEFSGADGGPAVICEATGCFADVPCPYGDPGDRLWVRETFATESVGGARRDFIHYRATPNRGRFITAVDRLGTLTWANNVRPVQTWRGKWTSPIHMPRWASRILLEITGVGVEQLKAITKEDAIAEGASVRPNCIGFNNRDPGWSCDWSPVGTHSKFARGGPGPLKESDISLGSAVSAYGNLWESINGEGSWAENPYVWVLEFKRI